MAIEKISLYFGANIPDSADTVSDADFEAFLLRSVDPEWDGYTLTEGVGVWRGERERVRILSRLVDDFTGAARRIARAYAHDFGQDCVLVERLPVSDADFVESED